MRVNISTLLPFPDLLCSLFNPHRSTAKKFLAAANFLELLSVFDKSSESQTVSHCCIIGIGVHSSHYKLIQNDEKIRYAKWRAADIAKAIREGRKPTPPAAAEDPEALDVAPRAPTPTLQNLPDSFLDRSSTATPGNWSTIATPGIDDHGFFHTTTISDYTAPAVPSFTVGNDVDGADGLQRSSSPPNKKVHFSASVVGGLSSNGSPPHSPSGTGPSALKHSRGRMSPTSAPLPDSASSGSSRGSFENPPPSTHATIGHAMLPSVPNSLGPEHFGLGPVRTFSPSDIPPPPPFIASAGLPEVPSVFFHHIDAPSVPVGPAGSISPPTLPRLPPAPMYHHPSVPPPPLPPKVIPPTVPAPPSVEVELSTAQIAKAQKHCRLAISALDYEDARHARKELLEALALLDGAK